MAPLVEIITGSEGTGKTELHSAINLRSAKYGLNGCIYVVGEVTPHVLNGFKRDDMYRFQEAVLNTQLDWQKLPESAKKKKYAFFFSGIPDGIAHFNNAGKTVPDRLLIESRRAAGLIDRVFILEPPAECKNLEQALKMNDQLRLAYLGYGITPVTIPSMNASERQERIYKELGISYDTNNRTTNPLIGLPADARISQLHDNQPKF